jgi:DNA-binding transcriptional MerR regulator
MARTRSNPAGGDDEAPATPDDGERLTIEQLAMRTGLPFTTIRLYQHRGLLPPPERQGRVGYYGPAHQRRLELIGHLRERGYSLASIKDLVDRWQEGRSLPQVLGLEASAVRTLQPGEEVRMSLEELADRFADVTLDPADLQRAQVLGLIGFEGDRVVVSEPTFLDVGVALARLGVPIGEILDEYERLHEVAAQLAIRFTALFERNLWEPFVTDGMPADRLADLTDALSALGPLAEQVVVATLRRAIAEKAEQFLADRATDLP